MVHHTKQNLARFPFDFCFPKMPSYLRRAAITHALGAVSSYHTRLDKWEAAGQEAGKGTAGKPVLNTLNHAMPVFYLDNMYREGGPGTDTARLKLYNGHDWVWEEVRLRHTDMEYLRKHWAGHKASAPVLEKKHKKYFLRFSYTQECPLVLCKAAERRTGREGGRGGHGICPGKQGGCDRIRVPGHAQKNTWREEAEAAYVEEAGYPEAVHASGTPLWNTGRPRLRLEYQCHGL